MNKVAKILSAVVSVAVALSMALVMLTSALAAPTTTFALNVVSENDDQIVVSVDIVDGGFQSIDFAIKVNSEKISGCSKAEAAAAPYLLLTAEASTLEVSGAYLNGNDYDKLYDVKGAVATFTFDKVDGAEIGPDDITVEFEVCGTVADQFEVVINNNIPEIEVPSEPSEEPSEPSEEPSEPSEEPSEPSEEPSKPSEDKTDAPVADGDVVNPDTGDSVTASAAIISLLAVSGAAIVALRKKED